MANTKVATTVAQRDESYGRFGSGLGSLVGAGFGVAAPIMVGASLGGEAGDLMGMEDPGRLAGGVAGLTATPITGAFGGMAGHTIGKNIGQEAAALQTSVTPRGQLARAHVRGSSPEDAKRFQDVAHAAGTNPKILAGIDDEMSKRADLEDRSEAQVFNDAGLGPRGAPDFKLHGKRVGRGTGALVGNTASKWIVSPAMSAAGTAANRFIPEHQAAASKVLDLADDEVHDYVSQVDLDPNTTERTREAVFDALKLRGATSQTNPQASPEGSLASPLHSA